MTVTPTITNVTVTSVAGNSSTPWSVATITTSTITNPTTGYSANVESVLYQLTASPTSTYAGAIQADYQVGSNGALTTIDNVFYQADFAETAVYYGSEAADPLLLATSSTPANPGYAYTRYDYAADGALTRVIAVEANGKTFVGS